MKEQLLTAYFEADHGRLESLFGQYQALKRSDSDAARRYFKAFLTGLKRHIVWEEDVLFPEFEFKSGVLEGGPTSVMREEHRQIAQVLEAMHEKVRRRDAETDIEARTLLDILGHHNQKEERVLYPSLDGLMSREDAARLFLNMEQIPTDRFAACCGA